VPHHDWPADSLVTLINRTLTSPKGTESHIVVYRPVGENIVYVSGRLPIDNSGYYSSVAVHNPAALFAGLFKDALRAARYRCNRPDAGDRLEVSRSEHRLI